MRKIVILSLILLPFISKSQEWTGSNIKTTDPDSYPYGININTTYSSGWAREFSFSSNGSGKLFSFGAYGNGNTLVRGYIGGNSTAPSVYSAPWMTFLPNGNIGVGTTSPNKTLHVSGAWKNQIQFQQSSGTTNYAQLSSGTAWVGLFTGGTSERTMLRAYHDGSKVIFENGNVGIGTTDPQSKLAVNGQIRATEVKVLADISVPDYVFESDYNLRSLKDTKDFIAVNKHLPEIPSASEIGENGINLGDMNMKLLKKIEELTLHLIDQNERIDKMQKELEALKK